MFSKVRNSAWFQRNSSASEQTASQRVRLTQRQREVLALLCDGLPNKLIARRLGISAGTVKVHVATILAELDVSNRVQAVLVARRFGLHTAAIEAETYPLESESSLGIAECQCEELPR